MSRRFATAIVRPLAALLAGAVACLPQQRIVGALPSRDVVAGNAIALTEATVRLLQNAAHKANADYQIAVR